MSRAPWCHTIWFLALLFACNLNQEVLDSNHEGQVPPANQNVLSIERQTKLTDVLEQATVRSPLLQLPSQIPSNITGTTIAKLDFENVSEKDLGFQSSWKSKARMVDRGDGKGHALLFRSTKDSDRPPVALLIPAKPMAFYRVSRDIKGSDPTVHLNVLETAVRPQHQTFNHPDDLGKALAQTPHAGNFVRLNTLIRQHQFDGQPNSQGWSHDEFVFFSSEETHSLLLVFEPNTSKTGSSNRVWFDNVQIQKLEPSTKQRLLLIRDWYAMPKDGTNQALHAFGQFLPVPWAGSSRAVNEQAFEYRHGLMLPTSTAIQWNVGFQQDATLSFGLSLIKESPQTAKASCTVRLDDQVIFEQTLEQTSPAAWMEQAIQMSAHKNKTVTLTIETTAQNTSDAVLVMSNPMIWQKMHAHTQPNVFVIAVDTLRADHMHTYGYPRPNTPNIDAFAKDAIVFEKAMSQSNWTPESFASLFTSTYGGQHGVTHRLSVLSDNRMAARLRKAGYFAQAIVYKLLLYDMGFERGFDAYFNVPRFHLSKSYSVRAETNFDTAKRWLNQNRQRLMFLFFHLNDPHQPFNHAGKSLHQFANTQAMKRKGLSLPILIQNKAVTFGENQTCRACVRKGAYAPWFVHLAGDLYDGEVAYTDKYVGLFLDELKKLSLYEDALIVFVSDHGEALAQRSNFYGHGFDHLEQEQIHVPLIIKPPAGSVLKRGVCVGKTVRLLDVLPTVLEMAGLDPEPNLEGQSLIPLLKTASEEASSSDINAAGSKKTDLPSEGEAEHTEKPAISENIRAKAISVQHKGIKYVLHYGDGPQNEKLFDLIKDRKESKNVLTKKIYAESLDTLREIAANHMARTHAGQFVLVRVVSAKHQTSLSIRSSSGKSFLRPIIGSVKKQNKGKWRASFRQQNILFAQIIGADPKSNFSMQILSQGKNNISFQTPTVSAWKPFASAHAKPFGKQVSIRCINNQQQDWEQKVGVSGDELQTLQALGYVQ